MCFRKIETGWQIKDISSSTRLDVMPIVKDPKTGKTIFVMEAEEEEEAEAKPKVPKKVQSLMEGLPEIKVEEKPATPPPTPAPPVQVPTQSPAVPKKEKNPNAYWSTHKFHKRSVEVAMDDYPYESWQQVIDLCQRAYEQGKDSLVLVRGLGWANSAERDAAIIATLFLGGFRAQEICRRSYKMPDSSIYEVGLKKGDFKTITMPDGREFIEFRNIHILKKYRKIPGSEWVDQNGKKHWKTERRRGTRTFAFPSKEPLVKYLMTYANHFKQGQYLFDISYDTVYRVCTKTEPRLFPHLLRSWRATQLAVEYHYDLAQLLEWFSWEDLRYARLYAKLNVTKMAMMTPDIDYGV
jgi:hypothetical protein